MVNMDNREGALGPAVRAKKTRKMTTNTIARRTTRRTRRRTTLMTGTRREKMMRQA